MATTPTGSTTPVQRAPRSAKPAARGLARALRGAGITRDQQASGAMDLDQGHGVGGRRGAGAGKGLKIAGAAVSCQRLLLLEVDLSSGGWSGEILSIPPLWDGLTTRHLSGSFVFLRTAC